MRGSLLFMAWLAVTSAACVGDHELAHEQEASSDAGVDGEGRADGSGPREDAGTDAGDSTSTESSAPLDAGNAEGGENSTQDGEVASDAGPECVIGGMTYASGAPNPTNACQSCQPDTDTAAWSSVANGTSCATGEVCGAGTCGAGCVIAGTVYTSGTTNSSNPCQSCQPGTTTTDWSSVASGAICATGEVCNAGTCAMDCFIGGTIYASAAPNPTNACQSCQPSAATSAWSDIADGTACQDGGICHTGACGSGCEIAGTYSAANALEPNDPCGSCQPSTSTSVWSTVANGVSCGNGQVCNDGECGTQCDIGGTIYASGASNPTNACQSCQPGTSTSEWTSAANGTSCGSGKVCNAATCAAGCFIAGTVYTSGTANPTNACLSCQPATSTTEWSSVANGTSCAAGEVCSAGSCAADCFIAGTLYTSGQANPANACQSCQPGTSTTLWSSVANGTSCAAGEVCNAGTCAMDCFIAGTVYASGAANPTNACLNCQPGNSTTAWSSVANGTSCAAGEVCSAGSCAADCFVAGTIHGSGATANSGCESCEPATSTTMWTNAANGTSCGSGEVCNAGSCAAGCFIAGTVYASGAVNPSNACLSCQPGTSTTLWSSVANGTSCAAGEVCSAGSCAAGCFVAGTVYTSGAANPADACQSCQPGTNTTAFSSVPTAGCTPPRPIAPLSTARVTSQTPTLHWVTTTSNVTDATVDICPNRACSTMISSTHVTGTTYKPTTALPVGVVYWRLHPGTATSVTSPTWQFTVGHASAAVDTSWGTTLDVNGDGLADLAVGSNESAYVYPGTAQGYGSVPTALATGGQVASAGDVNGDGYADVIVGSGPVPQGRVPTVGVVVVYLGGPGGVSTSPTMLTSPAIPSGATQGWQFGTSVASAGDVNGDGYADVVVSGVSSSTGIGRAYVYLGGPNGLASSAATTLSDPSGATVGFGTSVAGAGDVNGDGFGDIIVGGGGAAAGGSADVYIGSVNGIGTSPMPSTALLDTTSGDDFGAAVASAGDVNGDGYADVIVGAPFALGEAGTATVYLGHATTGIVATSGTVLSEGFSSMNLFGSSVSSAGDLNGDGFADVVIGVTVVGSYVFFGAHGGIGTVGQTLTIPTGQVGFGFPGWGAGDVDGDGLSDIVVTSFGTFQAVSLYLGSTVNRVAATPLITLSSGAIGADATTFGNWIFGASD